MNRGESYAIARRAAGVALFLLMSLPALAQFPEKFTNLQYFPKTISRQQLQGIMRGFAMSLGTHCGTCHVETADRKLDFASDQKPEKRTARLMLKMVDEINHGYIAKLGDPSPVKVQCVTCHRGLTKPQTMNAVLTEAMEKQNVQAAIDKYSELRQKYYGSGSYDFSQGPLNELAESLLQKGNAKDAVAIMEMNIGYHPSPSPFTYNILAMAHKANGETEKAKADLEKLLQLQPENRRARQELEDLKSGH